VKSEIRSAADFKGRNVAEGAGYATKSILTNYLATRAGLPLGSYAPVMAESEGRREAVLEGLQDGKVDVLAFQEPMTSAVRDTGLTSTLYALTNREATAAALGDTFFAQSLFVSPKFIDEHPDRVQRLVNAFVRTMRFINAHTPREIVDNLPPSYFEGKDRAAEEAKIASKLSSCARDDYRFTSGGVQLVFAALKSAPFDTSIEGRFRARVKTLSNIDPTTLYTNSFVDRAMESIR
jgi:NitT/TauT family transport system substrate-binding protein